MNSILKSNSNVYKVLVDCGNSSTKAQCILPSGEVLRIIIPTLASKGSDKVGMGGTLLRTLKVKVMWLVMKIKQSIPTSCYQKWI